MDDDKRPEEEAPLESEVDAAWLHKWASSTIAGIIYMTINAAKSRLRGVQADYPRYKQSELGDL